MRGALVLVLVCLLLPAAAAASTARVSEYHGRGDYASLLYDAAAGEANDVTVQGDAHSVTIEDQGAEIAAGPGCAASAPHSVTCTSEYELTIVLRLGDEADHVAGEGSVSFGAFGGAGDDVLRGGQAGAVLYGDEGDDVLDAGAHSSTLVGGEGDDEMTGSDDLDFLMGGPGADSIDGRGDVSLFPRGDTVSYEDHHKPVTIDLSTPGSAAGADGEGDTITAVENADGGSGADTITAPQAPIGAGLGSRIRGFAGDDLIRGGPNDDDLDAGAGDDRVRAGGGDDTVYGDAGRDTLDGGGGVNFMLSEEGLTAQRDRVDCGQGGSVVPGFAQGPLLDVIDQSCSRVRLLFMPLKELRYRYLGHPTRAVAVSVGCNRHCLVRTALRAHGKPVGSARREIRRGRRRTLTMPLSGEARDELTRTGALRLHFRIRLDWGQRLRHRQSTSYNLVLHSPASSRQAGAS
jgi:Ca2+-binding RTX toxin-like protein